MAKSWLKNLIFEDADPKTENKQLEKQLSKPVVESSSSERIIVSVDTPKIEKQIDSTAIVGKVDKTLLAKLCGVLDDQSVEGIDYVKFKKSVDSLKAIQPEEDMRFTSAFLTLKATNSAFSKEYLLQTIDKYIKLMEQERKVGMDQLKTLRSNSVDKKIGEIEQTRKKVDKMKAEIQELTKFIAETEAKIADKQNEIVIKEADFNTTIDTMLNQLRNDRTKIETIIK